VAETTSRTLQQAILFSLKKAKRANPVGKFEYIGGARMKDLDIQDEKAWRKARAELARRGGASNEPDSQKALCDLKRPYDDDTLPEDEVLVFDKGEHFTLDDGVLRFSRHDAPHGHPGATRDDSIVLET
jgi:hypothetical protein